MTIVIYGRSSCDVSSRVGMTSWRTSKKRGLHGIDLHRLFLQSIFYLDKDARNNIAVELLVP